MKALLESIGKQPVICAASPGFIVPRIQALAMTEAAHCVEECFAPQSWKRLAALRKQHDPTGLFHNWLGHGDQAS